MPSPQCLEARRIGASLRHTPTAKLQPGSIDSPANNRDGGSWLRYTCSMYLLAYVPMRVSRTISFLSVLSQ